VSGVPIVRAGLAASCALALGAARTSKGSRSSTAGRRRRRRTSSPRARTTCRRRTPPYPTTSGGADFVVAVHDIDIGDRPDASPETIGYELDLACTSGDTGASCLEPTSAWADHSDGPGGIDNAVGLELQGVSLGNVSGSEQTNENTDTGSAWVTMGPTGKPTLVSLYPGPLLLGIRFLPFPADPCPQGESPLDDSCAR
jgi:hypothetical protein